MNEDDPTFSVAFALISEMFVKYRDIFLQTDRNIHGMREKCSLLPPGRGTAAPAKSGSAAQVASALAAVAVATPPPLSPPADDDAAAAAAGTGHRRAPLARRRGPGELCPLRSTTPHRRSIARDVRVARHLRAARHGCGPGVVRIS